MGKEGRERQVLHWALFFFRVLVTRDPEHWTADGLGVLGVEVRACFGFVEWLLKGREVRCLPKDAKKLLVEDRCFS